MKCTETFIELLIFKETLQTTTLHNLDIVTSSLANAQGNENEHQ